MSSIKEYQRKIGSLKNSRKITGSMKMISSIKLQKVGAQLAKAEAFRTAARHMETVLGSCDLPESDPSITGYARVTTVDMLLITGDRGLCGRFNTNSINLFIKEFQQRKSRGVEVAISCIGLRGAAYLKRKGYTFTLYNGIIGNPNWNDIAAIADALYQRFTSNATQEIWVVRSKRISSISEAPCIERIMPFTIKAEPKTGDYLVEEDHGFARRAVHLLAAARIYDAIVDAAVAEHAARMSAMDSANANCDRLIDKYTQLRNRARQSVITTELNEIVTGKEALES